MTAGASRPEERIARIDRIELLVASLERSSDASARTCAQELVATLLEWHRAAIRDLAAAVPAGELERLRREDDALDALLDLHDVAIGRVARKKVSLPIAAIHHCDLCGATVVEGDHRHAIDETNHRVVCLCAACESTRFRALDRSVREVGAFELTDADWAALGIPVRLVFFTRIENGVVARLPGPAGTTEVAVSDAAWDIVVRKAPVIATMRAEVDGLLVNQVRGARDAFIVSIDECFRLTGIVRKTWTGLGGGDAKDAAVAELFAELRRRAAAEPAR